VDTARSNTACDTKLIRLRSASGYARHGRVHSFPSLMSLNRENAKSAALDPLSSCTTTPLDRKRHPNLVDDLESTPPQHG
ncbi:MAG: hypothetical protein M0008_09060, partial [Actinomycetota bacterium]|nr:hypothetical protein [Actinomycetota bacterium]